MCEPQTLFRLWTLVQSLTVPVTTATAFTPTRCSAILPTVVLQNNGSGISPLLSAVLPQGDRQTTRDIFNWIFLQLFELTKIQLNISPSRSLQAKIQPHEQHICFSPTLNPIPKKQKSCFFRLWVVYEYTGFKFKLKYSFKKQKK